MSSNLVLRFFVYDKHDSLLDIFWRSDEHRHSILLIIKYNLTSMLIPYQFL